jgi:ElaA protein
VTPNLVTGDQLTAAQLYALLRLRSDVFIVEQEAAYADVDGLDLLPSTTHLWCEGMTAYLRLLTEPDGTARIGRVCVAVEARGTGLGGVLMAAAVEHLGNVPMVLDAQTYALPFYEKFGFVVAGERYLEDGIEHVTMRRSAEVRTGG